MQRSRGGLVFKAHRLLYHSTLGWRVIKKKKGSEGEGAGADRGVGVGEKLRDEHLEDVHQVCAHPHKRGLPRDLICCLHTYLHTYSNCQLIINL